MSDEMDFRMYLEDDSQQNSVKSNFSKKSNHSTKSNRSKKGTHSTKSNRSMKSSRHLTTDDMDFMNYLDDDSPKSKDSHSSKSQKSFQDEVSKAFSNIRADFTVASIVNVELNDDDQRQLAYHSSSSSESDPATVMKIVSNIQCKNSQCKTSGCGGNRSSSYCDPCLGPKQVLVRIQLRLSIVMVTRRYNIIELVVMKRMKVCYHRLMTTTMSVYLARMPVQLMDF